MNNFNILAFSIFLIPIKFLFFYIIGSYSLKLFKFKFVDKKELIFVSLILGIFFQYIFILICIFFSIISQILIILSLLLVIFFFIVIRRKEFKIVKLKYFISLFFYNEDSFYLKLINYFYLIFLLILIITTALVPFLEFESFRWLRPVKLMIDNGKFVYTPEEVMFWLPQTAQFHDAFNLSLGDITYVAADRIIIIVTTGLGLKILSRIIFKKDFSPLILCFLIANETGEYLIPHTFLKGHLYACLYGVASLILYLKILDGCLNYKQIVLSGLILGAGSSITYQNSLIIAVFLFHFIFYNVLKVLDYKVVKSDIKLFLYNGFLYFIPGTFLALIWVYRNLYFQNDPIYPYGSYYPSSGSYGLEVTIFEFIVQNLRIFEFSGFTHTTHVVGPFIGLGFLISIFSVFFSRRFHFEKRVFFQISFIFSILVFISSSFFSNISPRYFMNWIVILSINSVYIVQMIGTQFSVKVNFLKTSYKNLTKFVSSYILVFLVGYLYINFNLSSCLDQLKTAKNMGDFRKVSAHSNDLVNYLNLIFIKDKNIKFANPTLLGSDFYLKPYKMINYGWPPFETGKRWLGHNNPENLYNEIKKDNVNYIIYFSYVPNWMYKAYDFDDLNNKAILIKNKNYKRKSTLRETLVFFEIDEKGHLKKFNNKYIKLVYKSKKRCNYWISTGCYNNDFENQYLFKVRENPEEVTKWLDP